MTTDHVAIVTGANHGIGAATARALARQGCAVLMLLHPGHRPGRRRDPAGLPRQPHQQRGAVLGSIISAGGRAIAMDADLSDPATPAMLFDLAEQQLGPVDILVNNADRLAGRLVRGRRGPTGSAGRSSR